MRAHVRVTWYAVNSQWGWHRESLRRGVSTIALWRFRLHYWFGGKKQNPQ